MSILKRAIKYLKVKKMKTVVLILVFFVIGNFVAIMYGINQTANNMKNMIRLQMYPIVEYSVDYFSYVDLLKEKYGDDYLLYDAENINEKTISLEETTPLIQDSRVKAINSDQAYEEVCSTNITPIIKSKNYTKQTGDLLQDQTFTLTGNGYADLIEFYTGTYEIVKGRFYTENEIQNFSEVCLITEELALENQLNIGDSLTFYKKEYTASGGDSGNKENPTEIVAKDYTVNLDLEIIGIYKNDKKDDFINNESATVSSNYENQILLPMTTLREFSIKTLNEYWRKVYENENFFTDEQEYLDTLTTFDAQKIINESKTGRYYLLNDSNLVDIFLKDYDYLNTSTKFLYANKVQFTRDYTG